ncbi:hypothetical protein LIER_11345 [Lithospermum erythrorhizon]|uniref:Uncharacterized protein n=1 Tax=Lithospermum erythrorhizon TaxID=34254 RepID=A0AAV3PMN0_LITER
MLTEKSTPSIAVPEKSELITLCDRELEVRKEIKEQGRKHGRKNHSKVMVVRQVNEEEKEEEGNSPKERDNTEKRLVPHKEVEIIPFEPREPEKTFLLGTKLERSH